MPTKNTIRRDYLIIRRILQNDYPSKRTLLDYLKRYDTEIGERTFQRDLADIRSNFDIEIYTINRKTAILLKQTIRWISTSCFILSDWLKVLILSSPLSKTKTRFFNICLLAPIPVQKELKT